jgi:hypothetical protein
MKCSPSIPYPEDEKPKLDLLEKLFVDWHQCFVKSGLPNAKQQADEMVCDGFYPHYCSRAKKILFVARESRDIPGCNYIDLLFEAYRTSKYIGDQHLNMNKFNSRLLYIAYGILHDFPAWDSIPSASQIGDTFGSEAGVSFAFMNISKFSNDAAHWRSNWDVINEAHRHSVKHRNFIEEEVAILNPDIVITMNLEEKVASLGKLTLIANARDANSHWLDNNGHRSLLIDTWHFAAPNKQDIPHFYEPICEAVRRGEALRLVHRSVTSNEIGTSSKPNQATGI